MNIPEDEILNKLKKDQILIGVLNPYLNEKNKELYFKINCFSLELLPRIIYTINGYFIYKQI